MTGHDRRAHALYRVPWQARFWEKVRKQPGDGCWIWVGSLTPKGYGQFYVGGRMVSAHRLAWKLLHPGIPIPPATPCVLHNCPGSGGDNPACVRHLHLGTVKINNEEMVAKGRQARGTRHGRARLNETQVLSIRRLHAEEGLSERRLALLFGVGNTTVHHILAGLNWAWLGAGDGAGEEAGLAHQVPGHLPPGNAGPGRSNPVGAGGADPDRGGGRGRGMRVLVCGGRSFDDASWLYATLNELNEARGPITALIHGAASGADTLASCWGNDFVGRGAVHAYPAEWHKHGRAAGPIRNGRMLTEGKPDLVVAFPGGRGTANMIHQAKAAGVEVLCPVAPGQEQTKG